MMTGLGPILASFAAMDIAAFRRKMKRNVFLYAFAILFLLTAYVLAVAALAIHLGQMWGLPVALLSVAGGALVLGLFMFLWVAMANRAEERRKREAAAANSSKALMVTAALSALPMLVKSRPLMLASVAAGLGFLVMKNTSSAARGNEPE
jgi:ABC-type Na+ efflux pump permease subunit